MSGNQINYQGITDHIVAAIREKDEQIASLTSYADSLERDAMRYRWLRQDAPLTILEEVFGFQRAPHVDDAPAYLDERVDAGLVNRPLPALPHQPINGVPVCEGTQATTEQLVGPTLSVNEIRVQSRDAFYAWIKASAREHYSEMERFVMWAAWQAGRGEGCEGGLSGILTGTELTCDECGTTAHARLGSMCQRRGCKGRLCVSQSGVKP